VFSQARYPQNGCCGLRAVRRGGGRTIAEIKEEETMSILTRWEPFGEAWPTLRREMRQMRRFQRAMDRLFGRWGIDLPDWPGLAVAYPPVNLWEDDDFVYAETELPGLKLPDVEITVAAGNQLTIKGKREPAALEKVEWHRQERGFGSFERTIELPVSVDAGKVEARLENGVLTIKMAKSPAAKPRKITVKAE
jgi:HSP20 family protein